MHSSSPTSSLPTISMVSSGLKVILNWSRTLLCRISGKHSHIASTAIAELSLKRYKIKHNKIDLHNKSGCLQQQASRFFSAFCRIQRTRLEEGDQNDDNVDTSPCACHIAMLSCSLDDAGLGGCGYWGIISIIRG